MTQTVAENIYTVAIAFTLVTSALVPLTYQWYSKGEWRRHSYGRHLMGSDTLIVAILVFYFIASITDSPATERIIGAALMTLFGILRIQRTKFMRRSTQSTGYDNQPEGLGENERNPA